MAWIWAGLLLPVVAQAVSAPDKANPPEGLFIDCETTLPQKALALWKQGKKLAEQGGDYSKERNFFKEAVDYVWSGLRACPQQENWWAVALELGLRGAKYPFPWKEKNKFIAKDLQGLAQVARNRFPRSVQVALAWAETKQTLSAAQAVYKMIPQDPRAQVLLGHAELFNNQPQKALQTLQAIAQPDAYALLWLAIAQLINGSPEGASKTLALITKKKIHETSESLRGDHQKEAQEGSSVLTALVLLEQNKPVTIRQGVARLRALQAMRDPPDVCEWVARAGAFDKIDTLWTDLRVPEKNQKFLLGIRDECYLRLSKEKLSM